MKYLIHIIFWALILLATFFGIGPVLMADGVFLERMITLAIVILIYVVLIFLYRLLLKKVR